MTHPFLNPIQRMEIQRNPILRHEARINPGHLLHDTVFNIDRNEFSRNKFFKEQQKKTWEPVIKPKPLDISPILKNDLTPRIDTTINLFKKEEKEDKFDPFNNLGF